MRKISTFVALLSLLAVTGASARHTRMHSDSAGRTKEVQDLQTLVGANLQEAANLRAELPSLRGSRTLSTWRMMIADHSNGAKMLAWICRRLGTPIPLTTPAAQPDTGSRREIIAKTLKAHVDTLKAVQDMTEGASAAETRLLHKVGNLVRSHITMIRSLQGR